MRSLLAASLAAIALVVAACGSSDDTSSGSAGTAASTAAAKPAAAACDKASLPLKSSGTLTVGTDKPAYPPYFEDDKPTNGKGFESAVAYAVAKQLGLAANEVK
jgi:polar amino acid transport system substrate-binding protein